MRGEILVACTVLFFSVTFFNTGASVEMASFAKRNIYTRDCDVVTTRSRLLTCLLTKSFGD